MVSRPHSVRARLRNAPKGSAQPLMQQLVVAMAPALIMGFMGWVVRVSSRIMELKASPVGSMPTLLNTRSYPAVCKARIRVMVLEMLWMENSVWQSPWQYSSPSGVRMQMPSFVGSPLANSGM